MHSSKKLEDQETRPHHSGVSNSAYHAVSMRVISTEMRRRSAFGALA